ncbi:MAG: hypothetical protein QXQ70_08515 [Candidatus Caldarchaeum sp.]
MFRGGGVHKVKAQAPTAIAFLLLGLALGFIANPAATKPPTTHTVTERVVQTVTIAQTTLQERNRPAPYSVSAQYICLVKGPPAQERLKLLERFLSSAARIPLVLRDPGTGVTLKSYRIGLASIRVAAEGMTGRYFVSEPELEPEDILGYSMALENIYMKAEIPEDVVTTLSKRSHRTDVVVKKASVNLSQALEPRFKKFYCQHVYPMFGCVSGSLQPMS